MFHYIKTYKLIITLSKYDRTFSYSWNNLFKISVALQGQGDINQIKKKKTQAIRNKNVM